MSEHFHSLVSLLVHHAQQRPHAIALRHKKFGLWQQWSWQQLSQHTAQYAAALHTYGFQPKQTFLIISTPNVDIVALSLAVQAFGGVVQLLDHDVSSLSPSVLAHQLEVIAPEYVFIEQLEHLGDLAQLKHCPTFAFYLESNHLQEHAYEYIVSIDQLLLDGKDGSSIDLSQSYIQPSEDAFAFERIDQQQRLSVRYTHQELIEQAQQLTKTHQLDEHEDAFIARAFSSIGHIRYLWSSWLLAGFSLNIPESLDTRDQDRQTIAPTLVLGTQQTYARVRELILSKLPEQTSLLHRVYSAVRLKIEQQKSLNLIEKIVFGLLKQVILEELGFSRLTTALIVGEIITPDLKQFYQYFGIELQQWGQAADWQPSQFNPKQVDEAIAAMTVIQ